MNHITMTNVMVSKFRRHIPLILRLAGFDSNEDKTLYFLCILKFHRFLL